MIYAPLLGIGLALILSIISYPIGLLVNGYQTRSFFGKCRPVIFRGLRRCGAMLRFLFDFLAAVFCTVAIVIYDCGYLGGSLRLHHIVLVLLGSATARFLYRHFLGHVVEGGLSFVLDLLLYALHLLSLPICLLFDTIRRFLYNMLLIYRRKRDKIIKNRIANRYRKRELAKAETAYLPHAFWGQGEH